MNDVMLEPLRRGRGKTRELRASIQSVAGEETFACHSRAGIQATKDWLEESFPNNDRTTIGPRMLDTHALRTSTSFGQWARSGDF
eukprot:scaffold7392_cov286-Pinguiococcus_pyrenoidosus.AAC.7